MLMRTDFPPLSDEIQQIVRADFKTEDTGRVDSSGCDHSLSKNVCQTKGIIRGKERQRDGLVSLPRVVVIRRTRNIFIFLHTNVPFPNCEDLPRSWVLGTLYPQHVIYGVGTSNEERKGPLRSPYLPRGPRV